MNQDSSSHPANIQQLIGVDNFPIYQHIHNIRNLPPDLFTVLMLLTVIIQIRYRLQDLKQELIPGNVDRGIDPIIWRRAGWGIFLHRR